MQISRWDMFFAMGSENFFFFLEQQQNDLPRHSSNACLIPSLLPSFPPSPISSLHFTSIFLLLREVLWHLGVCHENEGYMKCLPPLQPRRRTTGEHCCSQVSFTAPDNEAHCSLTGDLMGSPFTASSGSRHLHGACQVKADHRAADKIGTWAYPAVWPDTFPFWKISHCRRVKFPQLSGHMQMWNLNAKPGTWNVKRQTGYLLSRKNTCRCSAITDSGSDNARTHTHTHTRPSVWATLSRENPGWYECQCGEERSLRNGNGLW